MNEHNMIGPKKIISPANSLFSSNNFCVTSLNQLRAPSKVSGLERSKTIATP